MRKLIDWLNKDVLANLPAVPFKVIQLAILDFCMYGWGVALSFRFPGQDSPIYNGMLIAVCSLHGVNLGAYGLAKFKSGAANTPLPPETGEYPVPPAPAPVAAAPVVATTTTTTVTPGVTQ